MAKKNDQESKKSNREKERKNQDSYAKTDQKSEEKTQEEQLFRLTEVELGGEAAENFAEQDDDEDVANATEQQTEVEQRTTIEQQAVTEDADGKRKRCGFWHKMNVSYPWLKFAAAVLLVVGVTLGGFGVASLVHGSKDSSQVAGTTESNEEKTNNDKQDGDDSLEGGQSGENQGAENPEEIPEEKPAESPESPGTVTVVPPKKPVEVPDSATGKKLVALTFDDGPSAATTSRLLDILKEKNVKVTFFVLGNLAERNPALLQREEAEGHEVGSHTPYHNQQTKLSPASIQAEAATMNQIFINILGHSPAFTRPPYGSVNDSVRTNLAQPLILWSIDPEDWKYRNAATVRANVVGAAYDGAIALMHDIHATTVDAVPGIIDDLRAQGYEFLTVSELAKARGVALQNGWTYYNFRP